MNWLSPLSESPGRGGDRNRRTQEVGLVAGRWVGSLDLRAQTAGKTGFLPMAGMAMKKITRDKSEYQDQNISGLGYNCKLISVVTSFYMHCPLDRPPITT